MQNRTKKLTQQSASDPGLQSQPAWDRFSAIGTNSVCGHLYTFLILITGVRLRRIKSTILGHQGGSVG